ncbi:MAG TPA: hypothetical protein VD931_01315, partial [Baekduia sp.]|nr:hypothetical protein [Baekduia sp.]
MDYAADIASDLDAEDQGPDMAAHLSGAEVTAPAEGGEYDESTHRLIRRFEREREFPDFIA